MLDAIRTDRGVIRKVLRGNPDAFRVLVDRYGGMVYGIACAHVGNAVDAEDISQETFVRLYQWLDRLSSEKSVGAWLVQVARHVAIDWIRKQGREMPRSVEGMADAPSLPNPARDELHRAIWDQLATLGSDQREILVLYYFRSKRRREIARLLGITPYAASKRLERARDELGRRLIDALGDDWAVQKRDAPRANRIMAAVAASPVAWKPSASLALSGAAIVGASATKVTVGIACSAILIAALVYGGWRYMSRPYSTKEISAASTFEFQPTAQKKPASVESRAPGDSGAKQGKTTAEASEKKVVSAVSTGLRVHGLLITEDRQPVAGATVTIDNDPEVELFRRDRESGGDYPEVGEVKFAVVSDQQGRFEFESIPFEFKWNFYKFRLWSRHGGLAACENLDRNPSSNERYYELVMMPEAALAGMVTDMQGVPIPSAYVGLRGARGRKDLRALPADRAYTDKDGQFTFEFFPPGSYRFEVDALGFSPLETPWVTAGVSDLLFQLDTGSSISGRVVEAATGKALPHVGVFARERSDFNYRVAHADADDRGEFTISGLIPATFLLSINRTKDDPNVPYALPEPVSVTVPQGQSVTGVELRAVMGGSVSGRVVDADTAQPPQTSAFVLARGSGPMPWQGGAKIEKDGSYTIYGFPPGEYTLTPGYSELPYAETKQPVRIRGSTPITGMNLTLAKLDKNTGKDQLLTGKVIDETGAAVEGANVAAVPSDNSGFDGSSALTDAEGEFAISFVRTPKQVYVQAFMQGAMSRRAGPIAPLGNSCTLRLEPAGRIEGTVVDESGEPVSGAVVAAIGDEDAGSIMNNEAAWRAMREIRGTKAGTSKTGTFLMPSVMAGSYRLEVYVPAAALNVPVAKAHAQVRAGDTLRTRLVVDTQGLGTIEGTITMNGSPVQDTHVSATSHATGLLGGAPWMDSAQDYSDSSGHYVLPHIQPGKARVVAELIPSGQTNADLVRHNQFVEVEAGQTATADFNLNVEKTGAAEGYVYVNGTPSDYVDVKFLAANAEEDANEMNARTNGEGWFRVEGLAEGTYLAEAREYIPHVASDFRLTDTQEISVKAGETVRVDFHMNSGRIEGTVSGIQKGQQAFVSLLDGSGGILSMTPQVLQSMEQRVLTVMSLPQDGPFVFDLIPEGDYVLGAVAVPADASEQSIAPAFPAIAAGKFAAAEIQVVAGETVSADLVLP